MEVGNLILHVIINFPKENMYWPIDHLKGRFTAVKDVFAIQSGLGTCSQKGEGSG